MIRSWRALGVGVAVVIAAYTGFQMPTSWTTTLQAVSLTDGFHKRFLVGTLLRPLALATHFDYRLFAGFSIAVLLALVAILWRAATVTPLWSRRMIIVAWLLLPSGGFLFDEVGYFDQVVYLMLVVALWFAHRDRMRAAAIVMAFTPLVHEVATLTVIPLFGLYLLRRMRLRRAALLVAPAAVVGAVILLCAGRATTATADHVEHYILASNWAGAIRYDAIMLFERTQREAWQLYSIGFMAAKLGPIAALLVGAFVALWCIERPAQPPLVLVGSCLAIIAPALLLFGGWDDNRWLFLMITNFAAVIYLTTERELRAPAIALVVFVGFLLAREPIYYFERRQPRVLAPAPFKHFVIAVGDGDLFAMP